ncbi:site-specific DNA-methyltransferase [bacterium]|nr:site-specific DNA-methyltransferase [bacterium]
MKFENEVIQGDCLKLFRNIPDDSVDVTFADPPFNLKKKYNNYSDTKKFQDYLVWCKQWISEMVRVTKPTGSIFIHNIPKWLTFYATYLNEIAAFKHWISWDAPTAPMGKSLQPSHYGILYYAKNVKQNKYNEIRYPHKRCRKCGYLLKDYGGKKASLHPFGPLVSDVWTDIHRIKHNKYRDHHPCQLPIHLLERIILMSTDEGDIVLDPFLGTGTTAIAAKRLGRNYIGFELDENYIVISQDKITIEKSNSKIGNIWVSFFSNYLATIRNTDWEELSNHFLLPPNNKAIDRSKIDFKERKKVLKQFEFIINGNGSKKKSRDQINVELKFCDC